MLETYLAISGKNREVNLESIFGDIDSRARKACEQNIFLENGKVK